eukprot:scaffold293438_cov37-Tisochrysis_lutea.AAC.1
MGILLNIEPRGSQDLTKDGAGAQYKGFVAAGAKESAYGANGGDEVSPYTHGAEIGVPVGELQGAKG